MSRIESALWNENRLFEGDRVGIGGRWVYITTFCDGIEGGMIVEPPVQGLRSWNVEEVTAVEKDCSCGVRIRMLKHLSSGRVAPITVEPSSRGNVVLEGPYWRTKRDGDRGPFYLNHFTDCPDAERYGGSRAGNPAYRDDDPPTRQNELFPLKGVRDYTR